MELMEKVLYGERGVCKKNEREWRMCRVTDVMSDSEPHGARIEKPTHPVTPEQTRYDRRQAVPEREHEQKVPTVLPPQERIAR
jgi:hypothetical protein